MAGYWFLINICYVLNARKFIQRRVGSEYSLGPCETPIMKCFLEKSEGLKPINYFRKNTPSWAFDRVLNTTFAVDNKYMLSIVGSICVCSYKFDSSSFKSQVTLAQGPSQRMAKVPVANKLNKELSSVSLLKIS